MRSLLITLTFFTSFFYLTFTSNSQENFILAGEIDSIMYTDIQDTFLTTRDDAWEMYYNVDLNQDNEMDFLITAYFATGASHKYRDIFIEPYGNNKIAFSDSIPTIHLGTGDTVFYNNRPKGLHFGDTINSSIQFLSDRMYLRRYTYWPQQLTHFNWGNFEYIPVLLEGEGSEYGWIKVSEVTDRTIKIESFGVDINPQISFIEFNQDQCGLITNHGYTYENISQMCGSHSAGYKIYLHGEQKYEKCIEFGGCSVLNMMFISETTGFLIERNSNGHTIYKTNDSGANWLLIGGGAPAYLGFYLVNANTGYLITTWDDPLNLYINRVSDISDYNYSDSNINQNTIINDTIFGESFCELDTLGFKIRNYNDTIEYKIALIKEASGLQDFIKTYKLQFYPNPSSNFVFFQEVTGLDDSEYIVTDLSGKMITTGVSDNNQIYIGNLRKGIYLIQLTNKNGGYFGKIIKK